MKSNNYFFRKFFFKTLNSTNDKVKLLVKKNKKIKNICVIADKQTKGYGRRKEKWYSYRGNLHLSILIKPNCIINKVNQLSFLSSVSVGETIKKFKKKINLKYKWPNDILLNKKKVSGILIETSINTKNHLKWVVIGIGVNISKYPRINNIKFESTSLYKEKILTENIIFLNTLLDIFSRNYRNWIKYGFSKTKKEWIKNLYKEKNKIIVKEKKKIIQGKFLNLDDDGSITIDTNGKIIKLAYGSQII